VRECRSSSALVANVCLIGIGRRPFGLRLRGEGGDGCQTVPAIGAGLPAAQSARWSDAGAIYTAPSRTAAVADWSAPHGCWSGPAGPPDFANRQSSSRTLRAPTWSTHGLGPDRRP